jgi:hypothetical protein
VQVTRSNGRPDTLWKWRPARPMTPRETELLTETKFTRPVDFHSFRRRFKQTLAENHVELQEAMRLTGASSVQAHVGYLKHTSKWRSSPRGLSRVSAWPMQKLSSPKTKPATFLVGGTGIEPATTGL